MACTEDPGRSPFPQDPTACPPGTRPASPVPRPGGRVLAGRKEKTQVNSQCSTRKHGRRDTRSVTLAPSAP
jgi:hypothetical protein